MSAGQPRQDGGQSDAACTACGGTYWTDAEDGGQCINCGATHPDMRGAAWTVYDAERVERERARDEPELCPMGCGSTTEDVYGGPCKACWDATP